MQSLFRRLTLTASLLQSRQPLTSAAFVPFSLQRFQNSTPSSFLFQSSSSSNSNDKNMSDEVAKAKEAAKQYDLSSNDGAGPDTIFDKLLSGEWPTDKVYEDDRAFAFRDVNPAAPVHILVIPKNRDGLVSLSKAREDQKELLGHLMYVAQEVGKKECPNGFRIVINDGEEGAQSVFHLHLHILGGRQMGWPPG